LFGLLVIEELVTHAIDLRAQLSDLVVISLTTDQESEVIARNQ
jgi:hypothetical protein